MAKNENTNMHHGEAGWGSRRLATPTPSSSEQYIRSLQYTTTTCSSTNTVTLSSEHPAAVCQSNDARIMTSLYPSCTALQWTATRRRRRRRRTWSIVPTESAEPRRVGPSESSRRASCQRDCIAAHRSVRSFVRQSESPRAYWRAPRVAAPSRAGGRVSEGV